MVLIPLVLRHFISQSCCATDVPAQEESFDEPQQSWVKNLPLNAASWKTENMSP